MAEQHIRFCTTEDGVRIAYATAGEGPPLVLITAWVGHLQFEWDHRDTRHFYEGLARGRALVRFDRRGTGLSDREADDFSIEGRLRDLQAVLDALKLERFALMGLSESGPTAITFAARYPEMVSHLVVYGSFHRWPHPLGAADFVLDLIRKHWGMGSAALASIFVPSGDPGEVAWFTELQRVSALGENAAMVFQVNTTIDTTSLLGTIRAPTLVVHRRDDAVAPFDGGRQMAALIPDCRFEALDGAIHPPMFGDTDAVLAAIDRFLPGGGPRPPLTDAPSPFRTVLFTDLVGHTEMMARLGDEQGRAVLREHERITRDVLKAHQGQEIKTMGDGFMASFSSVTRAAECAIALQRAFATHNAGVGAHGHAPLHVRVGLNAGEPIEEEGDLFGASVIVASRVAAQAGAGEILIPEPVRHLLAGKSFVFADRGEVLLKGFEDAVRLFEVRWEE